MPPERSALVGGHHLRQATGGSQLREELIESILEVRARRQGDAVVEGAEAKSDDRSIEIGDHRLAGLGRRVEEGEIRPALVEGLEILQRVIGEDQLEIGDFELLQILEL